MRFEFPPPISEALLVVKHLLIGGRRFSQKPTPSTRATVLGTLLLMVLAGFVNVDPASTDAVAFPLATGPNVVRSQISSCPHPGLKPGRHKRTTIWEGVERWYGINVPPASVSGKPLPMVLNLHPFALGGNPLYRRIWRHESGLADVGNAEGFVTVQPDGTGMPASWNGGEECCGEASANEVDDVGFIRHLIDLVAEETCIDRSRVYAAGMSNGGYLSHRLGCEASDVIAAIAPVVGSFSKELTCDLDRRVPVLQISGSEDNLDSRTESVERWLDLNDCTGDPVVTYQKGVATCHTWQTCADGVKVSHCIVEDGGHCWFSDIVPQATPGCRPMDDLVSQEMVWDFVSQWSLP